MPFLLDSLVPSTGLPNLTQAIELLSAPEEIREEVTAKLASFIFLSFAMMRRPP